jgi:HPt (histidine-containing phosphotransfer) domain-containing protein
MRSKSGRVHGGASTSSASASWQACRQLEERLREDRVADPTGRHDEDAHDADLLVAQC